MKIKKNAREKVSQKLQNVKRSQKEAQKFKKKKFKK